MATEIAEFYGLNPFELSDEQATALQAGIPRMEARRFRRELRLHPEVRLGWEQVYNLVLAETGDAETAEYAARQSMAAALRSGQTPH